MFGLGVRSILLRVRSEAHPAGGTTRQKIGAEQVFAHIEIFGRDVPTVEEKRNSQNDNHHIAMKH